MDLHLAGKTALVTGASRGIGLATATALVAEGVRVVGAARHPSSALEDAGALGVPVDLTDPDGADRLVERAVTELGGLDLLVNNVGGGDGGTDQTGGSASFSDQQWCDAFEHNVLTAVRTTRAALPHLVARGGAVVTVSSNAARTPHAGPVPYTAAKAALTAFSKAVAEEYGPRGVRVNTVSPGPVGTDLWLAEDGYGAALASSLGVPHARLLEGLPAAAGMVTGRLVTPDEVAALVAYLASPRAASTTGTNHLVDGGAVKTV